MTFDEIVDIPAEGQTEEDAQRPRRKDLMPAASDNLLFAFRRCHNYIAGTQGLQKPDAFWELLKIIFSKIEDERSGVLQEQLKTFEVAQLRLARVRHAIGQRGQQAAQAQALQAADQVRIDARRIDRERRALGRGARGEALKDSVTGEDHIVLQAAAGPDWSASVCRKKPHKKLISGSSLRTALETQKPGS